MLKVFKITTSIILCLLCLQTAVAQKKQRPKIGLTLSGGGAKGIAHLGLLKAIDSVGLQVDYVTGTSVGSIVGGLYAAGYTGNEIAEISKTLKWNDLLSNAAPRSSYSLKEKEDYGHYIELPLNRGKIALKRGIIDSNELWLKLSEIFFPYYEITDFSKYHRGFQCIATDLGTGKIVVLKKGDIVSAIRASMAIPSVFTPVEIDGKVLVDGGVARNFPVSNVKQMGANIVIGSDVSGRLAGIDEVKSPLDIIGRLPFYNAVTDLEEQKKLADIYVDYPLDGYSTGSFSASEEIMKIGLQRAKEIYPILKRLKDSLDGIYGPQKVVPYLKKHSSVIISEAEVHGIPALEIPFFLDLVSFKHDTEYTAEELTEAIRKAFSLRIYSKINHRLVPGRPGTAKIIFDVEKPPTTIARFGLNYNSATGFGLKTGLEQKGFLNPFSSATLMFSIGPNPRGKASIMYYFNKRKKLMLFAETNFEIIDLTTYNKDYNESGFYNQASQNCDFELLWHTSNNWTLGVGSTLGNVSYSPKIASDVQAKGSTMYLNTYLLLQHNSLNTPLYPNRGRRIYVKGGVVYNQRPDFDIYMADAIIATEDSPFFSTKPFTQFKIALDQYIPIQKHAFLFQVQSGLNFNYRQILMNDFMIGGLSNTVRNQVTFAGLQEASIFSSSVISAKIGYQHCLAENLYVIAKVNGLYYDFIKSNYRMHGESNGIGFSLTGAYRTFLGPVEASLMYSDINNKLLPYFNIGYILSI
ncbi:hypothetical protein GR160_09810 [Flavobacterium sp. Sd200]|uniref:patatin-like phospholipase family protein n=1 Tax=Flavobacterium sp. Sd200 TaxID=2692211 RepID=UPI00136CDF2D|nr:patatin-like phospholipase family protein [Flavobacterium sp. Sd200]MXN91523.1 hypothetical protein [Flavobacterium sp. Sd200]